MDPLGTPKGRQIVERHVEWIPAAIDTVVAEGLGLPRRLPALRGLAWSHDSETGWAEEIRAFADGRAGDPDDPDSWDLQGYLGADEADEAVGASLIDAMRRAGDDAPEETIAAAVADRLRPRDFYEVDLELATGFSVYLRRGGAWTRAGAPLPPPKYTDLPHLGKWVDDDDFADRLRARIVGIAEAVRSALANGGDEWCAVALVAVDDGESLDVGYLFALTTQERDASPNPAALLRDPATWTEYTPMTPVQPPEEGKALARALVEAGCFEPETIVHREVVDRLRAGSWPGARVSDDLRMFAGLWA